jgi:ribosomal protein L14E/L6E/L27E
MGEFKPGQLVRSTAGRDRGEHYLVIAVLDSRQVLVANGRNRPLSRPKKKNTAHLQYYDRGIDLEALAKAQKVTDSQIARHIKELAPQEDVSETGG